MDQDSDRYEIRERIGSGTMGTVYRAWDREARREVALKQMSRPDAEDLFRLKHEFRSLAEIVHPHLIRLYELVAEGPRCFFTPDPRPPYGIVPSQGIALSMRAGSLKRTPREVAALSTVARTAWIVLLVVPLLQWALERSAPWPVAPSRMLAIGLWLAAWGPIAAWAAGRVGPRGRSGPVRAALVIGAPLVGAALLFGVVRLSGGPFGPVPGGRLRGVESAERQPDWRHTDALRYVALELASGRSLEMLCVREGPDLYVAANYPETKRWPHEVRRAPDVVVRVDGTLYPRRAVFIDDDARRRALLDAMNAKYGFDVSLGTGRAWFFRLDPPMPPGFP